MGPLAETIYELFSPIGDVADYMIIPLETVAWSTIFYDEYLKRPFKELYRGAAEAVGAETLDLMTNPRGWGIP